MKKKLEMLSPVRIDRMLLVVLTMFFAASCGTEAVKFNPDFWESDYVKEHIISERGDKIACSHPDFNKFVAMHVDKMVELRKILKKARVPKEFDWLKKKRLKRLDGLIQKLEQD